MDFLSNEASLFPGVHFLLETTSLTVATAPSSHLKVFHFLGNGCLTLEKLRTRVTSVSYSEHIHFGMTMASVARGSPEPPLYSMAFGDDWGDQAISQGSYSP